MSLSDAIKLVLGTIAALIILYLVYGRRGGPPNNDPHRGWWDR